MRKCKFWILLAMIEELALMHLHMFESSTVTWQSIQEWEMGKLGNEGNMDSRS